MSFFDETKSIVENIYLLTGPLIFIVALFGLKQLKIAKDSIRINSRRESAIFAFKLVEKYFAEFAKLYDDLIFRMNECGVDYEKIENLNLHPLDKIESDNENYKEYQKLLENHTDLQYYIWYFADKLESFSIPFIKKIADEEIAYSSEFTKFIQYCNLCSIEIIETKKIETNDHTFYENVIELYSIWKLRSEKDRLEMQVASLVDKKNKIKTKFIKPLGTE